MTSVSKKAYLTLKLSVIVIIVAALALFSCNKKCGSLESSNSGLVVSLYDFKECFPYATFDATLVIDSDSAFNKYKSSHFINCNAQLEPIDFSKHVLLGFKTTTNACNAAFHRNVSLDSANKIYRYTVSIETCKGCGTELLSTNFVVAAKIPAGYTVDFVKKDP